MTRTGGCSSDSGCPPLFAPLSPRERRQLRSGTQRDCSLLPTALRASLRKHHARIMDLFLAWDVNRDGHITSKEFQRALKCLGIDATRGDISDLFAGLVEPSGSPSSSHIVPPDSISYKALQRALIKAEPREKIATKVSARRIQVASEHAAAGREAALRVLLDHEREERGRAEARQRELEDEVDTLQKQLADLKRQMRQLEQQQEEQQRAASKPLPGRFHSPARSRALAPSCPAPAPAPRSELPSQQPQKRSGRALLSVRFASPTGDDDAISAAAEDERV